MLVALDFVVGLTICSRFHFSFVISSFAIFKQTFNFSIVILMNSVLSLSFVFSPFIFSLSFVYFDQLNFVYYYCSLGVRLRCRWSVYAFSFFLIRKNDSFLVVFKKLLFDRMEVVWGKLAKSFFLYKWIISLCWYIKNKKLWIYSDFRHFLCQKLEYFIFFFVFSAQPLVDSSNLFAQN